MADKPLQLISGVPTEVEASSTSAGAADAGKIPALNASGQIDDTMLPASSGTSIVASENLAAGDLVNVFDDAGTIKMRKADASSDAKRAHGFVLAAVTAGVSGTVTLFDGSITGLTGLTLGAEYFLSGATPGGLVATPPSTSAYIVQSVGVARSATELLFRAGQVIVRA